MKPLFIRIILIFTALPALVAIVLFLPFLHQLALNCILIVLSIFASYETAHLLGKRNIPVNRSLVPILGGTLPIITYLTVIDILSDASITFTFILLITIVFFREVFHRNDEHFKEVLIRISSGLFIITYPGVFLSFVIKMTSF